MRVKDIVHRLSGSGLLVKLAFQPRAGDKLRPKPRTLN